MNIRILLIEDDKKKVEDIKEFLATSFNYKALTVRESYQSGMKTLFDEEYDLLLLDMSIPTWDKSPTESGGDYQKFGGYKILKEVTRKQKAIPTILITMFDDFGESDTSVTLEQLDRLLREEFADVYKGAIFYSSRETKWKEELKSYLS